MISKYTNKDVNIIYTKVCILSNAIYRNLDYI